LHYHAVCISMVPPHPPFTLFPYTTLFRSTFLLKKTPFSPADVSRLRHVAQQLGFDVLYAPGDAENAPIADEQVDGAATADYARLDRKSTRLNSSHDQISYAVFCLKEKKES